MIVAFRSAKERRFRGAKGDNPTDIRSPVPRPKTQDLRPKTVIQNLKSKIQNRFVGWTRRLANLHADQGGTISIASVITLLMLVMVLGMVMNAGREADGKIRLQNAADAAAYSGGLVIARGMNTLAFSNNLLADVFAMTAYMREARDGNSAKYVPSILQAWNTVSQSFSQSKFPKFVALGSAIRQKTPLEQNMVTAFGNWASACSEQVLPLMEMILSQQLIPQFEQAVVTAYPDIAQQAAMEVAQNNGQPDYGRGTMLGVLWRGDGYPVGGESETIYQTLAAVDPVSDQASGQAGSLSKAQNQRSALASQYLAQWNNMTLAGFDTQAQMCQFSNLWRSFTCGYLNELLNVEYPQTNLPMVILSALDPTGMDAAENQPYLDHHFNFVGVAYWKKLPELMPGLYHNPMDNDAVAYAQVSVFVPRARLVWVQVTGGGGGPAPVSIGGVPGDTQTIPSDSPAPVPGGGQQGATWVVGRQGIGGPVNGDQQDWPWSLVDQRWSVALVPATLSSLPTILQTVPPTADFANANFQLPNLGSLQSRDFQRISPH
jgi:hypothetical protein